MLEQNLALYQYFILLIWYPICIVAFGYCSYTDLRSRRIPNRITYPFLLISVWVMALCGVLPQAVAGGVIAGGILLLPRLIGGRDAGGMGDVKLSALGGLLVGPGNVLLALFISFFSAWIILSPLVWLKRLKKEQTIAFGPYLAFGFTVVIVVSLWSSATWLQPNTVDTLIAHITSSINDSLWNAPWYGFAE